MALGIVLKMLEGTGLAISSHDPGHEDQFMEQLDSVTHQIWEGAIVALGHM